MENTRKVFIGWGYDKDGDVRNCGEFATVAEAEQAVANAGFPLAEVETEYRNPLTIDLTPTWAGVLPILIAGIENGNAEGRKIAIEELKRMAGAADSVLIAGKTVSAFPKPCATFSTAALLWTLYHHQGGSSHIGQHDRLTNEQIAQAKAFGGAE